MPHASPSALITDKGRRVLLRLQGQFYDLSQAELRDLLGLPSGSPGLGISIDGNRLRFEFTADDRTVELSAGQLHRRLAKQRTTGS
jgi:hypothetical protein